MSKYEEFFRTNAKTKTKGTYPATKALVDANGDPLLWTIRPLTTANNFELVGSCMGEVKIGDKVTRELDWAKYVQKLICMSVVDPNLYDKELQDSYGVMSPEDLVMEMINDPSEFEAFANYIRNFSGLLVNINDKVEEAKN